MTPAACRERAYWQPRYPDIVRPHGGSSRGSLDDAVEAVRERAGSRDSAAHAARRRAGRQLSLGRARQLARRGAGTAQFAGERFHTFSLRFEDAEYDETEFQRVMARRLGSEHHEVVVSRSDIAEAFPTSSATPSARSCAPRRRRSSCSRGWCATRASRSC